MSVLGAIQTIKNQATNFADIGDNFTSIWTNGGLLGSINGNIAHALQEVKPRNWNKNPGYVFKFEDSPTGDKTYRLQMNPQGLKQSEPFSIRILPTQGGIVTENEGFVMKDLIISGTTGIFPNRGTAGVTDSGFALISGGKSGYQELMEFRNFIREYAEVKTLSTGSTTKLIFQNFKDNEFWYVEPLRFDTNRSKEKPFSYDYEILFKIVGKVGVKKDLISSIFSTIDNVYATVDAAINVLNSAVGFLQNVEQAIQDVVLQPLETARYALQALNSGKNVVSSLPRKFYENLNYEVNRIHDEVCDFIGVGYPAYNTIYGRQTTLASTVSATYITPEQRSVLSALTSVKTALNQLLASDQYFSENISQTIPDNKILNANTLLTTDQIVAKMTASTQNILNYFNNEISLPTPNSATKIKILSNDTLEKIAYRYLGDATRWIEIVALNGLRYPYINTTRGEGVVIAGDQILIPSTLPYSSTSTGIIKNKQTAFTTNLSQIDKFLGIDLMLNTDNDLVPNNRKDLELVYGLDNIVQSVILKMGYEKGTLLYHPTIGIGLAVGERDELMIDELKQSIRDSLIQDPRIADVSNIYFKRQGSEVKLSLNVLLSGIQYDVPIVLTF